MSPSRPTPSGEEPIHPFREDLREILDREDLRPTHQIQALLRLGAEQLGIENGYLTRIDPASGDHTIVVVDDAEGGLEQGLQSDLKDTYCRMVVAEGGPVSIADAEDEGWGSDPAYQASGIVCYLGAKVIVNSALYGTACFMGEAPRPEPFGEQAQSVLELVVQGIERILERKRKDEQLSQTRQSLRQRESRLRGLANSIPGGFFQFEVQPDGTQRVTLVSDPAESLLGISSDPDGFLERFAEQVPAPHRERLQSQIAAATQAGEEWSQEVPFDRPDGDRIWVRVIATPEQASTAPTEPLVYHGIAINITDRQETERRYEAIFNQTFQFTGLMEPDGTLIEANNAALEVADLSESDVLGQPVWEAYWFQTGEETQTTLKKAVQRAARGEFVRYEETIQSADGRRTIDFSIRPVTNGEGEVTLLIPEGRDITERKERTRKLREREAALEQAGEAVLITEARSDHHPDGTIVYVNKALEEMTGYSEEEVLGKTPRIFQGPDTDPEVIDDLRQSLEAEEEWVGETVNYRKSGEPYLVRWSVTPVYDDEGVPRRWVSVQRDVTEKRRQEQELRAARNEAEEASRLKSAILANMSHELRTPLTSIIGFAEALRREAGPPPETSDGAHEDVMAAAPVRQFAERIETSGNRLLDTLTSAVKLSRLQAGELALDVSPVNVAEPMHKVADWFARQAAAANLSFETTYPERPLWAQANADGLRVVLENLLDNALKFTDPGGTVALRGRADGDTAILEVEDSGVGMDPDAVDRLTRAFNQESEGQGREYEGSGLGLTIAHTLVQHMEGTLTVDTEKGMGTRIRLRFSRATDSDDAR